MTDPTTPPPGEEDSRSSSSGPMHVARPGRTATWISCAASSWSEPALRARRDAFLTAADHRKDVYRSILQGRQLPALAVTW